MNNNIINNRIELTVTNRVSRLNIRAAGAEETTLEQMQLQRDSYSALINQGLEIVRTFTSETTEITMTLVHNNILNESGIINRIIYYLTHLQDLPMIQRLIISGGVIIGIVGGVYISYKIIKRTARAATIVTPFGAMRDADLTVFGRTIKRIGRIVQDYSIKDER